MGRLSTTRGFSVAEMPTLAVSVCELVIVVGLERVDKRITGALLGSWAPSAYELFAGRP